MLFGINICTGFFARLEFENLFTNIILSLTIAPSSLRWFIFSSRGIPGLCKKCKLRINFILYPSPLWVGALDHSVVHTCEICQVWEWVYRFISGLETGFSLCNDSRNVLLSNGNTICDRFEVSAHCLRSQNGRSTNLLGRAI